MSDRCKHGNAFYCGLCEADKAPRCEHGNAFYCGLCGGTVETPIPGDADYRPRRDSPFSADPHSAAEVRRRADLERNFPGETDGRGGIG